MDLIHHREVSEVLACFEQCREHQAPHLAAGAQANEGEIRLGQRISRTEFLAGQRQTRARVGGTVDGCHKVSRKGSAVAVGRSVCLKGIGGSGLVSAKAYLYGRKRRPSMERDRPRTALYLRVSTPDQKPDLQYD